MAPVVAATAGGVGTAVFQAGAHGVAVRHVDQSVLMVVTPTDAGAYPVAVFLHGCNMVNSWYERLLVHLASHGFIAVAPQLYGVALDLDDIKDIEATRRLAGWLTDERCVLVYVLNTVFNLHGTVKPDLSQLAPSPATAVAPTPPSPWPSASEAPRRLRHRSSSPP